MVFIFVVGVQTFKFKCVMSINLGVDPRLAVKTAESRVPLPHSTPTNYKDVGDPRK